MKKFLREDETGLFVMATKAIHKMGDISRDRPDLAIVFEEDDDNLYGNWFFGYGFINVKFPKNTTKELTDTDIEKFENITYGINSEPLGKLHVKDYLYKEK